MTAAEITTNHQCLFATTGFRRVWSNKPVTVEVMRDWDRNRLLKVVNGKVAKTMRIPHNWKDRERGDGRKWIVGSVMPEYGLHLTPTVQVVFFDKRNGNALAKTF